MSVIQFFLFFVCIVRVAGRLLLAIQQWASGDYLGAVVGMVVALRLLWANRRLICLVGVILKNKAGAACKFVGRVLTRIYGGERHDTD